MRCQSIGLPEGACAVARAQAVATLSDRRRDRMRGWYRFENVADVADGPGTGPADIFIYDEIVSQEEADFCGIGISAAGFVAALQEMHGQDLNVHINSPGGLVFDGIAIANALRAHDGKVNVIVDGIAASIASVIAMAGDTVTMAPHSMLMIHDAMGMTLGNAADHEQQALVLNKMSENIAGVYADRGDKRVNWRGKMQAETWLTDKEAVEMGLADRVDSKLPSATNAFDLSQYQNAPKHLVGEGKRPVFLAVNNLTLRNVASEPPPTTPESTTLTIRDAEQALRDAGFSAREAKAVLAVGWKDAARDEPESEEIPEPTETVEEEIPEPPDELAQFYAKYSELRTPFPRVPVTIDP